MYNKKNLAVIIFFVCLFFAVLFTALTARRNVEVSELLGEAATNETSFFKEVKYFKVIDETPESKLRASYLDIKNNNFLAFVQPEGTLYSEDREIQYKAEAGQLNGETSFLKLEGQVKIKDKESRYESEKFQYDGKREIMQAEGKVKSNILDKKTQDIIDIASEKMVSWMKEERVSLQGSVKGKIQRKRKYEGDLKFQSEELLLNQLDSYVKLDKSVKIQQNKMYLTAGNAEIFLENFNKKLKYYALYDDVRLEETLRLDSGVYQKRRAFAEKLEAHQRTGKLILTGAPRVEQGSDIIKGYQITLREAVEMIEVDDSQSSFKLKREE